MEVVRSDNLSQGQMPTIFEDRTLFPPPVIDAKFSQKPSMPVLPLVIFGFMLVPMLALGYFAFDLKTQLDKIDIEAQNAKVAVLGDQIVKLEDERDDLKIQVATIGANQKMFDEGIGRLVGESAALVPKSTRFWPARGAAARRCRRRCAQSRRPGMTRRSSSFRNMSMH
jgi:hypothetical protein